jgi:hypothetical protein
MSINVSNDAAIKIGMLVSYDYEYLYTSLPFLYEHVDRIVLAIDKERQTWSGGDFVIDESFFDWVRNFDKNKKITVLEESFYDSKKTPMQNEVAERQRIAEVLGAGGWHIQIDSDEYFVNFLEFKKWLLQQEKYLQEPEKNPVDIFAFWITLFKKDDQGYYYISNQETFPIATNYPHYQSGRSSNHAKLVVNYSVFHQSWARTELEIQKKIKNWGHSTDFDADVFFDLWRGINEDNYRNLKNFHPFNPKLWKILKYGFGKDFLEFLHSNYKNENISADFFVFYRVYFKFYLKNLRNRIRSIWRNK